MREVVIIGGGLTGLAAAYELEQHGVAYTLIEMKRTIGGSIRTVRQDGFTIDCGPFALEDTLDANLLAELGLADALSPLPLYSVRSDAVAFKGGAAMLVEALAAQCHGSRLMRMAVSSIGETESGRCAICLENGLLLDAEALIIAAPARHVERMFYAYNADVQALLLDYHYDRIVRLALGYRAGDVPEIPVAPPDMAFVHIHQTTHPARVPQDHVLWQIGMRLDPDTNTPEQILACAREAMRLPEPVTWRVDYWPTADPLDCYTDEHTARMSHLRALLPEHIAIVGSDYGLVHPAHQGVTRLDDRIHQGRSAARRIAEQRKGFLHE